ncbi:hypothetical protein A3H53_02455 [Candidatus Nomurabacteria bacterium RIFCSPLOWO2_02_FULL_40_10]|uniref:Chorismate mutase domain-containing protein n=2 Tax=Candidatus Nomuraibacteriota TaxID=1752729 RepID=A0A1F6Y0H2_9BACT|nr:MAG: hypothetical protein A2642_00120 [Candidatus Nomurabacteria bacterium RIFCSPHIGHO2_01_FULL_39_10]OGI99870.1 MAG: hypothetical protein A3H53_02455 [Candidatus Nomurabacteria bacterium RIFCSPLOWO2_02_FULL_40_10]
MNNLSKLRKDIDKCDRELINIFSKRFSVVKKVALYKKERNLKSFDPKRWREVVDKMMLLSKKNKIPEKFVQSILDSILKESLRIEENIISKNSKYVKK